MQKQLDVPPYGFVERIHDGIDRVLAPNPKDYTGIGTNTYVVGDERVWIIDPGPSDICHADAVLSAVAGRQVDGIFITHTHIDHSSGSAVLKDKLGAKTYGFGALSAEVLEQTTEDVDTTFVPDVTLADGVSIGSGDWRVMALHTPGHFPNHLCYLLPEQNILFSGDHVMGWSTSVVVPPLGNMLDYMESLNTLEKCNAQLMLPSHGDLVACPNHRIDEVRQHRKIRHEQVRACVDKGVVQPAEIVSLIYQGLSPRLVEAAKGSVMAHMEYLNFSLSLEDLAGEEGSSSIPVSV